MEEAQYSVGRRKFLRAAAILTVMTNSVMSFLSKTFGQQVDNAFLETLNVSGILPQPSEIGRKGIHLRWLFPIAKGFPDSFEIYRCDRGDCIKGKSIKPAQTHLIGREEKNDQSVFLLFNHPLQYLKIVFYTTTVFPIKIYHDDKIIEVKQTTIIGSQSIAEFQQLQITAISFPLTQAPFESMDIIEQLSETMACDLTGWDKIHTINYKTQFTNLRLSKLFQGCFNFYLPKEDRPRDKRLAVYENNLEKNYYRSIARGLSHTRLNSSTNPLSGENKAKLFNIFFLAIIDPNIAHILGLYFIDERIDIGRKYHYRIRANYGINSVCGSVYNLGENYDLLPEISDFKTEQVKESFFEFNKRFTSFDQLGSVQLGWNKPLYNSKTDPVSYFMLKKSDRNLQRVIERNPKIDVEYFYEGKKGELILPLPGKNDPRLFTYVDASVDVEPNFYSLQYELFGVDAYGRVGRPVQDSLKIIDYSIPPAPANLRIMERISGEGNKVFLQFSYGPFQYLRGPDISRFIISKKKYAVTIKEEVRYRILGNQAVYRDPNTGNQVFRVLLENFEITDRDGIPIKTPIDNVNNFKFLYFQPTKDLSDKKFALKQRIRYKIRRYLDSRTFEVETTRKNISPLSTGKGFLFADTNGSVYWDPLPVSVNANAPRQLSLIAPTGNTREISAKIMHVKFLQLKSYGEPDGNAVTKKFTEIIVNRSFFRSGILEKGQLRTSTNQIIAIKAQGSVYALRGQISDEELTALGTTRDGIIGSKILLEGYINLAVNQIIFLKPPTAPASSSINPLAGIAKVMFAIGAPIITTEGELLVAAKRNFIPESEIVGVAMSEQTQLLPISVELLTDISAIESTSPADALVNITKHIRQFEAPSTAFYFARYETEITSFGQVTIPDGKGTESLYFACRSLDKSDQQNISPLSLSVQQMVTKTTPPAVPPAAYACVATIGGKNYVPLANKEGRSALCIRWDKLPDDQHPPSTRFELTRALDVSIISVLKAKWSSCDLTRVHPSQPPLPEPLRAGLENIRPLLGTIIQKNGVTLNNLAVNNLTGIYEATMSGTSISEEEKRIFVAGRLKTGDFYFGIAGFNSNKIFLRLLTPFSTPVTFNSTLTSITLEKISDEAINSILADNNNLKQLADVFPDAFSMVTKVPVRCVSCPPKPGDPTRKVVEFIDMVPGLGNGRFFYKVRAVDAAENRSEWSSCSEPFYQVDLRQVDPVNVIRANRTNNSINLAWVNTNDNLRYEIFRSFGETAVPSPDNTKLGEILTPPMPPLIAEKGEVDLRFVRELPSDVAQRLTLAGIYRQLSDGTADRRINYLVNAGTTLYNRSLINVNTGLTSTDNLIIAGKLNNIIIAIAADALGNPLQVRSGFLRWIAKEEITSIQGIYLASSFDPSRFPLNNQTAQNFSTGSLFSGAVENNKNVYAISGLPAVLDQQAVILVAQTKMHFSINKTLDTAEPLKASGSTVALYKKAESFLIEGVYKKTEFDFNASPFSNQTVTNFYTLTSSFDRSMQRVNGINLPNGEKVVVVIEWTDGLTIQERLVSDPLSDQPIAINNNQLNLNWLERVEEIFSITTIQAAAANPTPFNYLLRSTQWNVEKKLLAGVNPHVGKGQAVVLELSDSSGSIRSVSRQRDLIVFTDVLEENVSRTNYAIVAYRPVHTLAQPNIMIRSKPIIITVI